MNEPHTYYWPGRVHTGPGAVERVGSEARDLGGENAFLLADPGVVAAGLLAPLQAALAGAGVAATLYDGVEPNPSATSVEKAAAAFRASGAQVLIGVGGGSGLDTAKAVKLLAGGPPDAAIWEYANMRGEERRPLPPPDQMPPYIAVPTTAGTGAEVTPWAVITHESRRLKFGVGDATTIPEVAVLDPALTATLPPHLTAATGMDALSHLIEAYVSTNAHPLLDPLIRHGMALIGRSLRPAVARGQHMAARQQMLDASLLGGIAISSNWLGACHSLAHPLSSLADLHHGLACGLMLPHQMAYSLLGAEERYADVAVALAPENGRLESTRERARAAVTAVQELLADVGLPTRLRDVGVDEELIPELAQAAYQDLNWWTNPRQVSEAVMAQLYRAAW